MGGAGSNRWARWLDHYAEELAVGTSWWVLPLSFGVGFPALVGMVFWLFRVRLPSQEYALLVILGLVTGLGLHLVARERERYLAAALRRSADLRALLAPPEEMESPGQECPECGMPMRRQSNGGEGTKFWGCTGFPACRFTAEDAPNTADLIVCERGHPMVRRVTRRSVAYWGCSTYPSCRRKKLLVEDLVPAR